MGGTGIFHCGVEVYGEEWFYSCTADVDSGSGIYCCEPRKCNDYRYEESVYVGSTGCSHRNVRMVIEFLTRKWPASEYSIFTRNCCHFSDTLCKLLGVKGVPSYLTSLAELSVALSSPKCACCRGHARAEVNKDRSNASGAHSPPPVEQASMWV